MHTFSSMSFSVILTIIKKQIEIEYKWERE